MLSTVSIEVVVLTGAVSKWSGIGMSPMSFIPFEFTVFVSVAVTVTTAALLSTSFVETLTQSLDMLFSLTTVALPSGPPSFCSRISFSVLSRLCLSLISSAKKLVSVIFCLMSNFFTAPDSPVGDRDLLPLEYRRALRDRCLDRALLRLRSDGDGLW